MMCRTSLFYDRLTIFHWKCANAKNMKKYLLIKDIQVVTFGSLRIINLKITGLT